VPDPSGDLAAVVAALADAVRALEGRVSALEQSVAPRRARPPAAPGPSDAVASALPEGVPDASAITRWLSLGGRTFLVLAGAFVLRALTDSGTLPSWLGVGLGVAYAATWLGMAERAGRSPPPWSAYFHGLASVLIAFPLLFEASTRFQLLSPVGAAAALALVTAAVLGVAAVRGLRGLAWLAAGAGAATSVALMTSSGRLAPGTVYLILLGVATLWLGYVRGWVVLRWPVAFAANLMVLVVAIHAVDPVTAEGPRAALAVQVALLGLYLGSVGARTLLLGRKVVVFEVVQCAAAILVGLGGAVLVAARTGAGREGFGLMSLGFALASYAVAFAFQGRLREIRANFHFYASLGLAFMLAGTGLLLSGNGLPLSWAALAVVAGVLARRVRSRTLAGHSAAYAVGASLASGLLVGSAEALFSLASVSWTPSPTCLAVLIAAAASAWLAGGLGAPALVAGRAPQLAVVAALALGAAGAACAEILRLLPADAAAGTVATVRTAVLVAGALALAWLGRSPSRPEAGWLAYPTLAAAGIKVLFEDVPRGRPATLIVSFGLYGAALILVPRLRGRRPTPPASKPFDGPSTT